MACMVTWSHAHAPLHLTLQTQSILIKLQKSAVPVSFCDTRSLSLLSMADINKKFREKKPRINSAIAAAGNEAFILLADNLEAQELINQATCGQAKAQATQNPRKGVDVLMTAVQNMIENFPNMYGKFITALENSRMGHIVKILEEGSSEFGEIMMANLFLFSNFQSIAYYYYWDPNFASSTQ